MWRALDVPRDSGGREHPTVRLPPLVRSLRPLQWTKNAVVFAALVFSGEVFESGRCCGRGGGLGLLLRQQRHVPRQRRARHRAGPRPPGEAPSTHGRRTRHPHQATLTAVVLFGLAVAGAWSVAAPFLAVVVAYVALMMAYSYGLKRLVILDVFAIAAGFVLRAVGGAVAIGVPVSPWLYVCTLLLALFVGFGKRRHELSTLKTEAVRHRANLEAYSVPLLDQIIAVVSSATVMTYSLYTFAAPNVPHNHAMMLTIPFVVYALFRYLYLVQRRDLGGVPETLLFADRPLLACIVGWGLTSVAILYLVPY